MSYVLSGYKRSLSVSVTKTINGVTQAGYPKTYPTATDIANGYFTYNAVNYSIPPNGITDDEFAQLTDIEYNQLLNAFRLYVMSLEDGLDFNTNATNEPRVYDASTCPPGTVVGTTTAEVTTTGEVTTTEEVTTTGQTVTAVYFAEPIGENTVDDLCGLTISQAISAGITDSGHVYTKYVGVDVAAFQLHTNYGYTIYNEATLDTPYVGPEEYLAVIDTGNSTDPFYYSVYVNTSGITHLWLALSCLTTTEEVTTTA